MKLNNVNAQQVNEINEDSIYRKVINHISFMVMREFPQELNPDNTTNQLSVEQRMAGKKCSYCHFLGEHNLEDAVMLRLTPDNSNSLLGGSSSLVVVIRPCKLLYSSNNFMGQEAIPIGSFDLHCDRRRKEFWATTKKLLWNLDPCDPASATQLLTYFIQFLPRLGDRVELAKTVFDNEFFLPTVTDEFAEPVYSVMFCTDELWQQYFNLQKKLDPHASANFATFARGCKRRPSFVTVAYPVFGQSTNEILPIVGYCATWRKSRGDNPTIWSIAVDPQFRGLGIAKKMVQHIIQHAEATPVNAIIPDSNFRMGTFYKKLGFGDFHFLSADGSARFYVMTHQQSKQQAECAGK